VNVQNAKYAIGGNRYMTDGYFNGMNLVHVRQYSFDLETNKEYPTVKGIALRPNRFWKLFQLRDKVNKCINESRETGVQQHLGGGIMVSVTWGTCA